MKNSFDGPLSTRVTKSFHGVYYATENTSSAYDGYEKTFFPVIDSPLIKTKSYNFRSSCGERLLKNESPNQAINSIEALK